MTPPTTLNDGRRETKAMTSQDGLRHVIVSYALTAPFGRWLDGLGHYPDGTLIPPAAVWSEMPTAADLARVHAEASAQ